MKAAGYSGTPLWKKLGYKTGLKAYLDGQPRNLNVAGNGQQLHTITRRTSQRLPSMTTPDRTGAYCANRVTAFSIPPMRSNR
jgi:hypothetical protein